jgi:hypothetical protein
MIDRRKSISVAVVGIGIAVVLVGLVLPPATILRYMLPADATEFASALLKGLWLLKGALLLNGVFLLSSPWWFSLVLRHAARIGKGKPFWQHAPLIPMTRAEKLLLAVFVLLAFTLRLIGSGQSLWGDDIVIQAAHIDRGLPAILTYWPVWGEHTGYNILAWICQRLPLSLEAGARLPAVFYGAMSVAASFFVVRHLFRGVFLWGFMLLHSVSLGAIAHCHMLKGYTGVMFFALACVVVIPKALDDESSVAPWVTIGLLLAAMLCTLIHIFLAIAILMTLAAVAVSTHGRESWRLIPKSIVLIGIVGCVSFLFYAMILPQFLDMLYRFQTTSESGISSEFFVGCLMQFTFWDRAWPLSLCVAALSLLGCISLFRRERNAAYLLILPPLLVVGSALLLKTFVYPRYLLFALPAFLVLFVEGASLASKIVRQAAIQRVLFLVCISAFLCGSSLSLVNYYKAGHQDLRGAVHMAREAADRSGGDVLAYGLARPLFGYYGGGIQEIDSIQQLEIHLQEAERDVYLLYAWRKAWAGREDEYKWIDRTFEEYYRFAGFGMDTTCRDGDVVIMVHRARTQQ